ncbi:hypothetical protein MRB53_041709 [Persea americana]|nr:hypothetical protein MRB53_041709 [Persea americana]
MLSGDIKTLDNLADDDFRRRLPRFQEEALKQNLKLVEAVEKIAKHKQVTTAQIALGWVVVKAAIPIPGTKTTHRVQENCRPAELDEQDIVELDNIISAIPDSTWIMQIKKDRQQIVQDLEVDVLQQSERQLCRSTGVNQRYGKHSSRSTRAGVPVDHPDQELVNLLED